ncbi:hypothetical protein J6590_010126 [Homalodisca vitripennis]|nr:hypothetical protein J6590_010126 [Homalodisca vitripennis]
MSCSSQSTLCVMSSVTSPGYCGGGRLRLHSLRLFPDKLVLEQDDRCPVLAKARSVLCLLLPRQAAVAADAQGYTVRDCSLISWYSSKVTLI